jgi:hypothetical protein
MDNFVPHLSQSWFRAKVQPRPGPDMSDTPYPEEIA